MEAGEKLAIDHPPSIGEVLPVASDEAYDTHGVVSPPNLLNGSRESPIT